MGCPNWRYEGHDCCCGIRNFFRCFGAVPWPMWLLFAKVSVEGFENGANPKPYWRECLNLKLRYSSLGFQQNLVRPSFYGHFAAPMRVWRVQFGIPWYILINLTELASSWPKQKIITLNS